jgi:hypothetical protein
MSFRIRNPAAVVIGASAYPNRSLCSMNASHSRWRGSSESQRDQDRRGNQPPCDPPRSVDPAGVEPALPARQADVFPLDHEPDFLCLCLILILIRFELAESDQDQDQGSGDDGNRTRPGCLQGSLATLAHASPLRSRRESNPVRRHTRAVCRRKHLKTKVAEAGFEPASYGL